MNDRFFLLFLGMSVFAVIYASLIVYVSYTNPRRGSGRK
jgi:hypothetical protein